MKPNVAGKRDHPANFCAIRRAAQTPGSARFWANYAILEPGRQVTQLTFAVAGRDGADGLGCSGLIAILVFIRITTGDCVFSCHPA